MPELVTTGHGVMPPAVPPSASASGTSTGTTTLTLSGVMGIVQLGSTITGSCVPAGTTITQQQSGAFGKDGVYLTSAATTLADITLTFTVGPTVPIFPDFVPIVPPPVIGEGGGPPPTFPPPTPPPIGHIPPGVLVGPAIAYASVPPSVAGFPQPQFGSGSATAPPANGYFPLFTTTFPVPTIVVDGNNFAVAAPGQNPPWTQPPPAQTPSTLLITIDGSAPQLPPWLTAAMTEAPLAYAPSSEAAPPPEAPPPPRRRRK